MDVKRLDQVARKLIANVPRREVVKTLAGALGDACRQVRRHRRRGGRLSQAARLLQARRAML